MHLIFLGTVREYQLSHLSRAAFAPLLKQYLVLNTWFPVNYAPTTLCARTHINNFHSYLNFGDFSLWSILMFFPGPQIASSHAYAHHDSTEETNVPMCGSVELSLCNSVLCPVICGHLVLSGLPTWSQLTTLGSALVLNPLIQPVTFSQTVSRGNYMAYVLCWSGITDLHCLMSNENHWYVYLFFGNVFLFQVKW